MIETVTKFRCSDGEEFHNQAEAEKHEKILSLIELFAEIVEEPRFPYIERLTSIQLAQAIVQEVTEDRYLEEIFQALGDIRAAESIINSPFEGRPLS